MARLKGRPLWDGQRLREIREARQLSQDELAAIAKVGKSEISRHETNTEASNPTVDVLGRLALALEAPLWTLFQPIGSPVPPRPGEQNDAQSPVERHPAFDALMEALQRQPAPDSIEAAALEAVATLVSALRRTATPGEPRGKAKEAGRPAASDR